MASRCNPSAFHFIPYQLLFLGKGVRIHDNALVAAATLSARYITDRFLPDKAIDLVDEACAMIRTEIDSMPAELDDLRRKIMQQEIEEMALKKEDDQLSRDRLEELIQGDAFYHARQTLRPSVL